MLPDETDKARKAAAEFLRARVKDIDRLTTEVSSTFFGVNISCAQCHDHPLVNDWKQDHFYGMKAFFGRTFVNGMATGFLGEHEYGTVKFKTTEGVERDGQDDVPDRRKVVEPEAEATPPRTSRRRRRSSSQKAKKDKVPPPPPQFSARAKLVELALQPGERDFFARAIVNRVWHRLFGRGLVMPLDQMHSANPPSHPELLAWLARDMVEHGYDLRRLIRGLVLSRAYARDSQWDGERAAPAVAVRRGPRPAADADATGLLAPARDRRPGQLCRPT